MNGYREIDFSYGLSEEDNDVKVIIDNLKDVTCAAATANYGKRSMIKAFTMDGSTYAQRESAARQATLSYAASKAGITKLTEKKDLIRAFSNDTFVNIFNTIVSETLSGVIANSDGSQLLALCNIDTVDIGDSKTYEIEPKGLPVAQRGSYMNNISFLDGYTKTPITVTPEVYTLGSSIDYIRILANGFDFGKELAKVAMGMLYAQYKLVAGILFDTANVNGTPLYKSSFTADGYTGMIADMQMLNKAGVKAYGTLQAFQKQGTVATTNYGFETQDRMISDGYLGHAYGVDNIVIDQVTDLSAPFVDANRANLLLIPTNKILLVSDIGDKPVKLVREDFVKIFTKEAKDNSLYRLQYSYANAFNAGLCTEGHFAIQTV